MNHYLLAAVLGLVEGLTEFLPVSSTAHIRLVQAAIEGKASLADNFWKMFAVVIQLPAIFAVIVYFWKKLLGFATGLFKGDAYPVILIGVAAVTTGIPALLAKKLIKDHLESTYIMGVSLIVGGVVMYTVDRMFGEKGHALAPADPAESQPAVSHGKIDRIHAMKIWQAVWIGAVQILSAIFPGTSRSMSSIAAGQVAGLTRTTALEFSFYLSIPIMFAACGKDLLDALNPAKDDYIGHPLTHAELSYLAIGSAVSFITALAVIAWFMAWVRRRGFTPFAIYRVIIGVVVLLWASRGG